VISKREKVIVGVMGLFIAYGIILWVSPSPEKVGATRAKDDPKTLNQLVIGMAAKVAEGQLSDPELYVLSKAEEDWKGDPFAALPIEEKGRRKDMESPESKEKPAEEVRFVYSGYLGMAGKRLAIVNGMEFEAGDLLNWGTHSLEKIEPDRLWVREKETGKTLVIPLQENTLKGAKP
jgi:hypothetical protein